jgi:predicted nucleic acid-binding protein/predicted RNase H-like HicB family nuclease
MKLLVVVEQTATGFSAYSPDMPGCVATGPTRPDVELTMREAMEFHIEGLRAEGLAAPEPHTYATVVEVAAWPNAATDGRVTVRLHAREAATRWRKFIRPRAVQVLSDGAVANTLRLMRRSDERLTLPVAREVAKRAGARIVVDGSVAPLGAGFLAQLRVAVDTAWCRAPRLTSAWHYHTFYGMRPQKVKATYSLDSDTVRRLDRLARIWNTSKSGALRRAIDDAAAASLPVSPHRDDAPTDDEIRLKLQALSDLQSSATLSRPDAEEWARRVSEERRAWAKRRELWVPRHTHLDTNFLILATHAGSEAAHLLRWTAEGRTVSVSAIVWAEFQCGPVSDAAIDAAARFTGEPVAFTANDAILAASLYNLGGRKPTSLPDCMIAATAMNAGATLATNNRHDFERFADVGLTLEVP